MSSLATSFGEKLQVSFFAVPSLDVRFSSILIPCFSLSLLAQSFSHDHTGFFFSSENEKKLSSEVSALKADLDLLWAEMEAERQMHQDEEKSLRARAVEIEKQRDAALQEARKNSEAVKNLEAVKKECNSIESSFCFVLYSNSPFC